METLYRTVGMLGGAIIGGLCLSVAVALPWWKLAVVAYGVIIVLRHGVQR